MDDDQFTHAKTIMTRIVSEKIPKAKRWSVTKEFKSWIDGLSKEQFQTNATRRTGTFILFGSYPPAESEKREQLARIGGEATAYYALALWRTIQVKELEKELSGNR
jgi:hypothetical protein